MSEAQEFQDPRPSYESWFATAAAWAALRADCRRRKVGAVIVRDRRVIGVGYNGALSGELGCLAGGCPRGLMSNEEVLPGSQYDQGAGTCIAFHAEENAILNCAAEGIAVAGASIYITDEPCYRCARLLQRVGIVDVHW